AGRDVPTSPELARLRERRATLISSKAGADVQKQFASVTDELNSVSSATAALPPPAFIVYAGATDFETSGEFRATFGKPRPIHVLARGSEGTPKEQVFPGTVAVAPDLPSRFQLP